MSKEFLLPIEHRLDRADAKKIAAGVQQQDNDVINSSLGAVTSVGRQALLAELFEDMEPVKDNEGTPAPPVIPALDVSEWCSQLGVPAELIGGLSDKEKIMRKPQVGDVVIYCDSKGRDHNALITAVWSDTCVNVVFVSSDERRTDDCGRQVERETSVTKGSEPGTAHGRYWRFADEERVEYSPPQQV